MVQIKEFRIVMPLSLEEYQVAQMYMVMKMQQESTTGDEGVEVLQNRPFSDDEFGGGQYTSKFYHLQSKAPSWLTTFAPADSLVMQEEAWNAYPKCRSVVKSPYFSKFFMSIDTIHKADNGYSENVHGLSEDQLAVRQVEVIDIASAATDYWSYVVGRNNVDLSNFQSARCGRGPLLEGWQDEKFPSNLSYIHPYLGESVLEFRRNQSSSSSEGQVVKEARGVGMILTNTAANGEELVADSHLLAVAVGVMAERAVKHYALAQNAIATLRFLGTKLSIRPSTGGGCTRGTNFLTLEILKPVMVAPGDHCSPVMTAYKLVTVDAPYWGFGSRLEQALMAGERSLFLESHRNCFAWIDEWFGLTVEVLRELERQSDYSLNMKLGRPCSAESWMKESPLEGEKSVA